MLTKVDAVTETEPLLLACRFGEVANPSGESASSLRRWRALELLPVDAVGDLVPDATATVRLSEGDIVCTPLELRLSRDEAQGYYLNLESPEPSVFFLIRYAEHRQLGLVPDVRALTMSYEQAARWMDGGEQVERLLAPEPLLPWLAEFTQAHFEVPFKKAKLKNRPSFMSRDEFDAMAKDEARVHQGKSHA